MDNAILGCERRDGECVVSEVDSVRDQNSLRGGADEFVALVVFESWSHIEAFNSAEVPRFVCGGPGMRNIVAARGSHGCSVRVVWSVEAFPQGHDGVDL